MLGDEIHPTTKQIVTSNFTFVLHRWNYQEKTSNLIWRISHSYWKHKYSNTERFIRSQFHVWSFLSHLSDLSLIGMAHLVEQRCYIYMPLLMSHACTGIPTHTQHMPEINGPFHLLTKLPCALWFMWRQILRLIKHNNFISTCMSCLTLQHILILILDSILYVWYFDKHYKHLSSRPGKSLTGSWPCVKSVPSKFSICPHTPPNDQGPKF